MGAKEEEKKLTFYWFDKKGWRIFISTSLTVAVPICCGFIPGVSKNTRLFVILIIVSFLLSLFQCIYSFRIASVDKINENNIEELETKIIVYKRLFEDLPQLMDNQANGLYKIAKQVTSSGKIPAERWTFDEASSLVCASIARFITDYSGSPVDIYFVKVLDDQCTRVKMVGCSNHGGDVSNGFMVERSVSDDSRANFDIQMIANNNRRAVYRLDHNSVDSAFNYNDREKESGKIEQFLFIPVTCNKQNVIGIIEVLVPRGHIIAESNEEMENIQKLLTIYSSLFYLMNKSEKAATARPPQKRRK